MEREKIYSEISEHLINQHYIKLIKTDDDMRCIPISLGDDFLLVFRFYDFTPYGYEIIPIEQIMEIHHTETNKYFEKIVKKEGAGALIENAPDVCLDNWDTIFSCFIDTGEIIAIDIGKEDCINLGKVIAAEDDELEMLCFSPDGIWDDENWIEPYVNITGIEFRNDYTKIFTKYLSEE